jgi:hypothetical protein
LNHAERLFFGEDRRVAVSHEVRWPAHGVRRVDGEGLADNQPVEELADRRSLNLSTRPPLVLIRKPPHPLGRFTLSV